MADANVVIEIGTLQLPKHSSLSEKINPIIAKNRTVSGKLFVDYMAKTRIWTITFAWLAKSDYDLIRAQYDSQFSSGNLLAFAIVGGVLSVPTCMAYLDMPNERKVKFAGSWVQDLTITIEEQVAI